MPVINNNENNPSTSHLPTKLSSKTKQLFFHNPSRENDGFPSTHLDKQNGGADRSGCAKHDLLHTSINHLCLGSLLSSRRLGSLLSSWRLGSLLSSLLSSWQFSINFRNIIAFFDTPTSFGLERTL